MLNNFSDKLISFVFFIAGLAFVWWMAAVLFA
jgi:hypothetical protein